MKRGFALLETIVVITFVCVSLLMLYGTFMNMFLNSRRNILYDDSANIYKMFYLKGYLELNGLDNYINQDLKVLSCDDFSFASCSFLFDTLSIENLYLVEVGLRDYNEDEYTTSFNEYIRTLSSDTEYSYRLVGEFLIEGNLSYASIGVNQNE